MSRWLYKVAEEAGVTDTAEFVADFRARLEKGAEEYNDSYLYKPFHLLVSEALEEGVDFPAWLMLALERLAIEPVPDIAKEHIEKLLTLAAAEVLKGWRVAKMAMEVYDEYAAPPINGRPFDKYHEE
jgi:hypothetical protein